MKRKSFFVGLLLSIVLCSPSHAWDHLGHMIVAQIAYDRLDAPTRKKVDDLIEKFNESHGTDYTFVTAACWMDDIRNTHLDHYDPWHFINPPFSVSGDPWPMADKHNVLWAIGLCGDTLAGKPNSQGIDRNQALVMLLHLVGDIHQPLHCTARNNDHGGNGLVVSNMTKEPKKQHQLHHFWDTAYRQHWNDAGNTSAPFYEHPKFDGQSPDIAHYEAIDLVKDKAAHIKANFQPYSEALAGTPRTWALQSHGRGFTDAYGKLPGGDDKSVTLNKTYVEMANALASRQLVTAGENLANYLTMILNVRGDSTNRRPLASPR